MEGRPPPGAIDTARIVLHIDLDAFYAQVERTWQREGAAEHKCTP